MSDIEPLPPALRALFDDERAAYPEQARARARVLRRIETAVALSSALAPPSAVDGPKTPANGAPGGASPAVAKAASAAVTRTAAWAALAFAGGLVAGELHGRSSPALPPSPAPSTSRASMPPVAPAPSVEPVTPVDELTPKPPAAPTLSAASPSKATSSGDPASDLAAEQAVIDTARAALSRGRGGDALRATEEHAARFPRGRLSQERELLAIQALLLSGARRDAELRGERFKAIFPRSLYRSAIDELLGTGPASKDAGQ